MTENIPQAAQELRGIVDRIVRLEDEKKETADAIKDIYTEAQSRGYDPKAVRINVKEQRESAEKRLKRERTESNAEIYRAALGTYITTPLGEAAMRGVG